MSGMRLIEPTELYNLINQEIKYPCLSDAVFMLLVGEILQLRKTSETFDNLKKCV